jgi:hypothetical protein
MQCPKVAAGVITFQHQVVPDTPPQPWSINAIYASQGWSIVDTLIVDSSSSTNITENSLLKVIYVKVNTGTQNYGVTCSYQIGTSSEPIFLDVQNTNMFSTLRNPSFKKLEDDSYICKTTAGNPEKCAADSVNPVVFGQ